MRDSTIADLQMKKKYKMLQSLIAFSATKPILLRTLKKALVNSFVKGLWEPAPSATNLTREKFRKLSNTGVRRSLNA